MSVGVIAEFEATYLDPLERAVAQSLEFVQERVIDRLNARAVEMTSVVAAGNPFDLSNYDMLTPAEWESAFEETAADIIADVLVDAATSQPLIGGILVSDTAVFDMIDKHVSRLRSLGSKVQDSVAATLKSAVANMTPLNDVVSQLRLTGPIGETSARMIARTELTAATNGGLFTGWKKDGVPFKRWRSLHDTRVRDAHLAANGQTVPIEQEFEINGSRAMYPGDPRLPISLRANCRCYMERVGPNGMVVQGRMVEATRRQLYSLAQQLQIPGRSKMNKNELFQAIDRYRSGFGEFSLSEMTRAQLLIRAKTAGITGRWRMSKPELMQRLRGLAEGRDLDRYLLDAGHVTESAVQGARSIIADAVAELLLPEETIVSSGPPPTGESAQSLRLRMFNRLGGRDNGWIPCLGCGAKLHWRNRPHIEMMSLVRTNKDRGWVLGNVIPVCRADAAVFGPQLLAIPDTIGFSTDDDNPFLQRLIEYMKQPIDPNPPPVRSMGHHWHRPAVAEFANPWHDHMGRFAPKGAGRRGRLGPQHEVGNPDRFRDGVDIATADMSEVKGSLQAAGDVMAAEISELLGRPVTVEMKYVERDERGEVSWNAVVTNANGTPLASMNRRLRGDQLRAVDLLVDRPLRGKGLGTVLVEGTEDWAVAHGATMSLVSTMDVGGYAWARSGYDFHPGDNQGMLISDLRQAGFQSLSDRLQSSDPVEWPTPWEISETPGTKKVLLDTTWSGLKTLVYDEQGLAASAGTNRFELLRRVSDAWTQWSPQHRAAADPTNDEPSDEEHAELSALVDGGVVATIAFANPWHDEIGRFAPKGMGRSRGFGDVVRNGRPATNDEAMFENPSPELIEAIETYVNVPDYTAEQREASRAIDNALRLNGAEHPDELREAMIERYQTSLELQAALNELAGFNRTTPEQLEADIENHLREVMDGKPVSTRVTAQTLEAILDDGEFRSQFETGTTRGSPNLHARRAQELGNLGLSYDTPDGERPIYGYIPINPNDETPRAPWPGTEPRTILDQYGEVRVEFNDSVRERSTFVFGDSLGGSAKPSPVNDPDVSAVNPYWEQLDLALNVGPRYELYSNSSSAGYLEAQIHGDLTIQDISRVVLPRAAQHLAPRLEELGIDWVELQDELIDYDDEGIAASAGGSPLYTDAAGAAIFDDGLDERGQPLGHIERDGVIYAPRPLLALLVHGAWQPVGVVASVARFANPWHDERGRFAPKGMGSTGAGGSVGRVSAVELDVAAKMAMEKATEVPQPSVDDVVQGQVDALLAREGLVRAGGDRRGNNTARKQRAKKLVEEFGDGETCPCVDCGQKLAGDRETADRLGLDMLTQDKILVGTLGGSYKLDNLVPACGPCNQSRGDREGVGVVSQAKQTWGDAEDYAASVVAAEGERIASTFQARRSAILDRRGIAIEEHLAENPNAMPLDFDDLDDPIGAAAYSVVDEFNSGGIYRPAADKSLAVHDPVRGHIPRLDRSNDRLWVNRLVDEVRVVPSETLRADGRAIGRELRRHAPNRTQFGNPWHDEIGRFAPKGTGSRYGFEVPDIDGLVRYQSGENAAYADPDRSGQGRRWVELLDDEAVLFGHDRPDHVDGAEAEGHEIASAPHDGSSQSVSNAVLRLLDKPEIVGFNWREREPGMWLDHEAPDGWRAAYDREAMTPEGQALYDAKFEGPFAWQRQVNVWLPGVKASGKVLSGKARSLADAKAKAEAAGQKEIDAARAKYDERTARLLDEDRMAVAQFANPWHDEIGRFAPKGMGSTGPGTPDEPAAPEPEPDDDYMMSHRPTDTGPRSHDVIEGGIAPPDVYEHPEWYTAFSKQHIRETMDQLNKVKGNPDAEITIYRAAPEGAEFNDGDWITLSKSYAKDHAYTQGFDETQEGDTRPVLVVHEMKVPASHARWAMDDLMEWGYFPDTADKMYDADDFTASHPTRFVFTVAEFANPWHDEAGRFAPKGYLRRSGAIRRAPKGPKDARRIDMLHRIAVLHDWLDSGTAAMPENLEQVHGGDEEGLRMFQELDKKLRSAPHDEIDALAEDIYNHITREVADGEPLVEGFERADLGGATSDREVWYGKMPDGKHKGYNAYYVEGVDADGRARPIWLVDESTHEGLTMQHKVDLMNGVADGFDMAPLTTTPRSPEIIVKGKWEDDATTMAQVWKNNPMKIEVNRNQNIWDGADPDLFMPTAANNQARFSASHEYGHVRMFNDEDPPHHSRYVSGDEQLRQHLSPYGKSMSIEAHAELFADWVQSGGESKNPATTELARLLGWGAERRVPVAASAGSIEDKFDQIIGVADGVDGPTYYFADGTSEHIPVALVASAGQFGNPWHDEVGRFAPAGSGTMLPDVPFSEVRIAYRPRHPDGHADPGEVVWANVPFEERDGRSKDRPVLVIGRTRDGRNLVGVQLSSKPGRGRPSVGSGDWDRSGRESFMDTTRFIQIDDRNYRREGAYVKKPMFQSIVNELARQQGAPTPELTIAEFGNPWHDEIGRFAPKGTGSKGPGRPTERARRILDAPGDRLYAEDLGMEMASPELIEFAESTENDPAWENAEPRKASWKDKFLAAESDFSKRPIREVVIEGEPLRTGYPPKLYEMPDGRYLIADGHHRVVMHDLMETDEFDVVVLPLPEHLQRERFAAKTAAFANPWHDEIGRFAPKGTGKMGRSVTPNFAEAPHGYRPESAANWKLGYEYLATHDMPEWWLGTEIMDADGLPKREDMVGQNWKHPNISEEMDAWKAEVGEEVADGIWMIGREADHAREHAILVAISTNQIDLEAAEERWGKYDIRPSHGPWEDLPGTLYHATSAVSAIEASGALKTRGEIGGRANAAGLGGGDDDTISFTSDRKIAEDIVRSLHEVRRAVNMDSGELVSALKERSGEWWGEVEAGFKSLTGRTVDQIDSMEHRYELYRTYARWRENKTGVLDPLFFNVDINQLAKMDPSEIGIVKVKPAMDGARGFQVSALGEWRTPTGSATTITDIERLDDPQGFSIRRSRSAG